MKYINKLFILFLFSSCEDSNLSMIENTFDLEESISISYVSQKEKWNDFNGDGYRIVNCIVDDKYNSEMQLLMESKGGVYKSRNFFVCSELENFIVSDSVLCLAKKKLGESHTLLFDSIQKTLIYFYEVY